MTHHFVKQLRFARSEFVRCLDGLAPEDGVRRLEPMNCISWMIGHLANQEQRYWVMVPQDRVLFPDLNDLVGHGMPATTPPLDTMWDTWRTITAAADEYLDTLTDAILGERFQWEGKPWWEDIGTMLLRNTYHYWFHTGEAHAVRQQLGHGDLPQFVGQFPPEIYRSTGA